MYSSEERMNPVKMTIINPEKEYIPGQDLLFSSLVHYRQQSYGDQHFGFHQYMARGTPKCLPKRHSPENDDFRINVIQN